MAKCSSFCLILVSACFFGAGYLCECVYTIGVILLVFLPLVCACYLCDMEKDRRQRTTANGILYI